MGKSLKTGCSEALLDSYGRRGGLIRLVGNSDIGMIEGSHVWVCFFVFHSWRIAREFELMIIGYHSTSTRLQTLRDRWPITEIVFTLLPVESSPFPIPPPLHQGTSWLCASIDQSLFNRTNFASKIQRGYEVVIQQIASRRNCPKLQYHGPFASAIRATSSFVDPPKPFYFPRKVHAICSG